MWPDTISGVEAVLNDLRVRAARHGRELRFGYRAHVIVHATEREARAAAQRLISRLDDQTGDTIRRRPLDTMSAGTVLVIDDPSGWTWARNALGGEGWVPSDTIEPIPAG